MSHILNSQNSQHVGVPGRNSGPAFLLAQIGSHAAQKFAERLGALELIPAHAGILRILSATPGLTQQALASMLGMVPSRMVALLDELDQLGLTERRRSEEDRRSHALHLTPKGRKMLAAVGDVAQEHQRSLLSALSQAEQAELTRLLQRIADEQGLIRYVHPSYGGKGLHADGGST